MRNQDTWRLLNFAKSTMSFGKLVYGLGTGYWSSVLVGEPLPSRSVFFALQNVRFEPMHVLRRLPALMAVKSIL